MGLAICRFEAMSPTPWRLYWSGFFLKRWQDLDLREKVSNKDRRKLHISEEDCNLFPFMWQCIASIIRNYNQQDATFVDLFISTDALHVSGGSSAHHQEHITLHNSFRYCQPILLLAAIVNKMELTFHLIHDSSHSTHVPYVPEYILIAYIVLYIYIYIYIYIYGI